MNKASTRCFLDLHNPYEYMSQVRQALKSGGYFGSILPTTNQVSRLIYVFHANGFAFVDVCEIILRYYKPVADRLRPVDRMVAHTGYLVFARALLKVEEEHSNSGRDLKQMTDEPVDNESVFRGKGGIKHVRRGPFRRSLRRTAPIGEAGRLALRQANQLKDAGEYTQAAEIFERVAQRMENRLRPNRAAFLYLQAGHCHLLAAQPDPALQRGGKRSLNSCSSPALARLFSRS